MCNKCSGAWMAHSAGAPAARWSADMTPPRLIASLRETCLQRRGVDGEKLAGMLEELQLGLKPKQTCELDESFFDQFTK
jgi:hypothetical protein